MTLAQLEHRLVTLEQKLDALAGKVEGSPSPDVNAWIDQIHGTFKDTVSYRQAARLGRRWRKSRRPSAVGRRKVSSE
jgi:hypothetical protein